MVAHRHCLGHQFPAPGTGHDHLTQVILAVTTTAAVANQGVGQGTIRLAAALFLIECFRRGFEDQVLLDIDAEPLATIGDANFLTVVLDASVAGAKSPGAVLTLTE
ncbi:MAG: hypothetical protein OXD50_11225 [Chloroflexi bacterium]|nr:hypothetical protein [Chloroflexota bacterium]